MTDHEEKLVLDEVVGITKTSFSVLVDQIPPAAPARFEDRYYLTSFYIDAEPDREPDLILTDPGYKRADFTGMPSGKVWYVQAWRRWPDDPVRPHMMSRHSYFSSCMTKADKLTIRPVKAQWKPDMTSLKDFWPSWWNRSMGLRCMHDDELGDFIRLDLTGEGSAATAISYKRFNKNKPITVKGRIRNIDGPWGAMVLYNGEAEDAGISWRVGSCDLRYTVNLPWSTTDQGSMKNRTASFEFHYDGIDTFTYWIFGEDGEKRLLGTRKYTLITDPALYIVGTKEGSPGYIDFAGLEVTGEETYGFSEVDYFWSFENSGIVGGTEWQHGYPQDGSEHYYAQAGGWSIRRKTDPDYKGYDGLSTGVSRDQYAYPAGDARMTSPMIRPDDGFWFKALRIIGSTRSGGTLKIYVKGENGKVINGLNQTGGIKGKDENGEYFTPVYGVTQIVDLEALKPEPGYIYFDCYSHNPNEGVVDQNIWSPPGLTHAEGTDTGPPMIKSMIVEFTV